MNVGIVPVGMREHLMSVRMRVGLGPVPVEVVHVPMMLVMAVPVAVLEGFVGMHMIVTLSQVKPKARPH